jgi:hypothetical protein
MKLAFYSIDNIPPICSCCGEKAETYEELSRNHVVAHHVRTTASIRMPYCFRCKEHVKYMQNNFAVACLWALFGIATLGLGFLVFYLAKKHYVEPKARTMAGPSCTRMGVAGFNFDGKYVVEVDCIPFARALVAANPQRVITTPEVQRLMSSG